VRTLDVSFLSWRRPNKTDACIPDFKVAGTPFISKRPSTRTKFQESAITTQIPGGPSSNGTINPADTMVESLRGTGALRRS